MSKLMKCKSCGETISKSAKSCPHCGESYEAKSYGLGTLIVIGGGLVWLVSSITGTTSTTPSTSTPKTHITPPSQTVKAKPALTKGQKKLTAKEKLKKAADKNKIVLEKMITKLKEQYNFNNYKTITIEELNARVQNMRSSGKQLNINEEWYKGTNEKLWKQAKALQIKVQKKHYPKMRDALGPLMRKKMWEHDVHVKTIGKGYGRMVLSASLFAANRNIKEIKSSINVMLSDYRFKRVDFKWRKGAYEWTYFDLDTKKDNEL